ncbi:TetR/AcrR family transcriptional regulator [Streptacidiphilus sp. ASG 303]|uniref:TetR/AcrR family transcriptional regulator n=1 Tax=Streptacidiphilus sp. ASG 303 TaxID=2896847 RepID=UPI001E28EE6D|nr:TetR/AcrR family transcriptional regulator [Streptacidiphilus sp. ASG 303]MCD0484780.1 TetR/AcrR family transcriptional regulator [Streptacidiphilus sp. ASG 303]
MTQTSRPLTRREEYAQATRRSILDAARRLFAAQGYFATKVEDVAAEARVAPATVYAVAGGKQGLLGELARTWVRHPAMQASEDCGAVTDEPGDVVRGIAASSRRMLDEVGDLVRVVTAAAPHDPGAAGQLALAQQALQDAFTAAGRRLGELGALRPGVDDRHAADVLRFYLCYPSFLTLHEQSGWSFDRAETWLAEQACRELLGR